MQRFDNTTTWFNESENLEKMIATDQIDAQPKKSWWPRLLVGVAGTTAAASFALAVLVRRPVPVVTRVIPAAPSQPCNVPKEPEPEPVVASVAAPDKAPAPTVAQPEPSVAQPEAAVAQPEAAVAQPEAAVAPERSVAAEPKKLSKKMARQMKARPVVVSATVLAGEKLLASGHTAAALREFQKEIARNPRDTRALKDACTALKSLGRVNDAARVCRHALVLDPDDLETRAKLASIYYSGGAYQWAANEWRRVLATHPGDEEARRGLQKARARL
jgi:hypothetical protein